MSGAIGEQPGMHVLAKPIGPVCDIDCEYCFYLEKRALFEADALTSAVIGTLRARGPCSVDDLHGALAPAYSHVSDAA